MTAKKKVVKKTVGEKSLHLDGKVWKFGKKPPPKKELVQETKKPKAGDITSMAFHYAGLVSWEEAEIDKVAKGKEVVWISNQLFEKKSDGTYVYEDNTVGPCKKVLHLDGGKRAREYEESGE